MEYPGDYSVQSTSVDLPGFVRPISKIHQDKTVDHGHLVRLLARRCSRYFLCGAHLQQPKQ
ncbi:hypothetical protein CCACVL1_17292 [Corchorus capsularis]|uniref:Uncharacterized protein n=1 Tax=Corchorus capsularis TaxID=210143 RepID=A0A1R3HSI2_COCAP|nr:hypothetical protein CCACVL1_17292 [Corchorus capsularis]